MTSLSQDEMNADPHHANPNVNDGVAQFAALVERLDAQAAQTNAAVAALAARLDERLFFPAFRQPVGGTVADRASRATSPSLTGDT